MKKLFTYLFILACFLLSTWTHASHIQAGDMMYKYENGNTYRVFVRIYRDRDGIHPPSSVPVVVRNLNAGCGIVSTVTALPVYPASFDSLASNLCPLIMNYFNGSPPFGTDLITYSALVVLPYESSKWHLSISQVNRAITGNLDGVPNLSLYCIINHSTYTLGNDIVRVRNSSVNFGDPTISLAESKKNTLVWKTNLNTDNHIQLSPNNPDGDILAFSLVPVISNFNGVASNNCALIEPYKQIPPADSVIYTYPNNSTLVNASFVNLLPPYISSFSASYPLPSISITSPIQTVPSLDTVFKYFDAIQKFELDSATGTIRFTPYIFKTYAYEAQNINRYAYSILCKEYRIIHGAPVLVGEVKRDGLIYVESYSTYSLKVKPTISGTPYLGELDSLPAKNHYRATVFTGQLTDVLYQFIQPLYTVSQFSLRMINNIDSIYLPFVSIVNTQVNPRHANMQIFINADYSLAGDSLDIVFEEDYSLCPYSQNSRYRLSIHFKDTLMMINRQPCTAQPIPLVSGGTAQSGQFYRVRNIQNYGSCFDATATSGTVWYSFTTDVNNYNSVQFHSSDSTITNIGLFEAHPANCRLLGYQTSCHVATKSMGSILFTGLQPNKTYYLGLQNADGQLADTAAFNFILGTGIVSTK